MDMGDIIIWILFILAIAVGLWYIFGNSPTLEQTILTFLLAAVFTIVIILSKNNVEINYIKKDLGNLKLDLKDSFNNMKKDIKLIKKKLEI